MPEALPLVPKRCARHRQQHLCYGLRDARIFTAWQQGTPAPVLAAAHGVTVRRIRQIIVAERAYAAESTAAVR